MRKFVFALEAVLGVRERAEERRRQTLLARQRELEAARAEVKRLDAEYRAHADVLRGQHRNLDAGDLRLHYAHVEYLDRQITAQMRTVADRAAAFERARAELLTASKERKVVEKLKERRRDAHVAEELRAEQKDMDDGNARRYDRTRAASEHAS